MNKMLIKSIEYLLCSGFFSLTSKPDKKFMSMFIGLIDGDGYIEIGPHKQYNKLTKSPVKSIIRIRLVIRLHNRDADLLSYIKQVLGLGSLSTLDSKIQKVVNFFSSPNNSPLYGYKLKQYNLWLLTLKGSSRYSNINYSNENNYNE